MPYLLIVDESLAERVGGRVRGWQEEGGRLAGCIGLARSGDQCGASHSQVSAVATHGM